MVEIIILHPPERPANNGTKLKIVLIATDISIIFKIVRDFFAGGIIIAINMA